MASTNSNTQSEVGRTASWRLLHRVYDIDALRCECGGRLRFEEVIESPKEAKAFLDLHKIESPRPSGTIRHIQEWSDAPNVALAITPTRPEMNA